MGIEASRIIMVIPCYNEANRLRKELFTDFIRHNKEISMLFVNDGSKDHTLEVLRHICSENPGRLYLLDLPENLGKGKL